MTITYAPMVYIGGNNAPEVLAAAEAQFWDSAGIRQPNYTINSSLIEERRSPIKTISGKSITGTGYPKCPAVYLFYVTDDTASNNDLGITFLYTGKAINAKQRLYDHVRSDNYHKWLEYCYQKEIYPLIWVSVWLTDAQDCAGLEAKFLQELKPMFNLRNE